MSRATNRTSNISVTWNFKNPNISRNELINYIHLFREVSGYSTEVSGYSRVLSRHCLAISAVSRFLYCLEVFVRCHFSTFIFHRTPARKSPERLSFPSLRPPESFPTLPPEISRFLLPLDSLRPRSLRQAPFLHFHQSPFRKSPERLSSPIQRPPESFPTTPPEISRFLLPLDISTASQSSSDDISPFSSFISHRTPARKSSERLFSPSQHTPESFPTTPPEISRFPFGTKVIKILDLSLYLPPTRTFAVSPTLPYSTKPVLPISKASLSYSPKPVLHQPRHQIESAPLVHQSPSTFYPHLTLSYNNTHQSSSSLPTITKFAFPTGPSALLSIRLGIHNSPRTELHGI